MLLVTWVNQAILIILMDCIFWKYFQLWQIVKTSLSLLPLDVEDLKLKDCHCQSKY